MGSPEQVAAPLAPIVFNDFKPGIIDLPGVQYPPGAAERTNTYRCRAKPSGALIPGPRNDYTLDGTAFEAANPDTSAGYFCSGIYAVGPILPVAGSIDAESRVHELWIAAEYGQSAPSKRRRLQRRRQFESAPTTDLIYTANQASATDGASAYGCTFGQSRANTANPDQPGIPVLAIAWPSGIATNSIMYEYPDDTAPTTNVPKSLGTDLTLVVTHQNRFVFRKQTGYSRGTNGSLSTTEDLEWTPANNPQGGLSLLQSFYPENTDGYSLMASMSANELFCLKESGAIVIIGDLDNPTINNLPMVPGSGGVPMSAGVRSDIGLLYPNRTGLWAWSHGDSAEHVSPLLLPDFYQTGENESFGGQAYSWYGAQNLIFLSNNFYLDTDTKSFWRLEDETVMKFRWMTGFRGWVYGARSKYTNASLPLVRGYNLGLGASSYSWQSHPIWQSIDRILNVREIELIAQGRGQIIVTLTDIDNNTRDETFTLANTGYPERFRANFAMHGRFVRARFQADSQDASIEAPSIHTVVVHPDTRVRVPGK